MFGNEDESEKNFHFMEQSTSNDIGKGRLSLDSGYGNDSVLSQSLNDSQTFEDSKTFSELFTSTNRRASLTKSKNKSTSTTDETKPIALGEFGSPPTKWARIRTPPNRKGDASTKPSLMFSPPTRTKYLMKTPESLRKAIRISSPSSIQVTISKTPLKLSNNDNVARYHIGRKEDIVKINSVPMIRCIGVTRSASKRCIIPNESLPLNSEVEPKIDNDFSQWKPISEPSSSSFEGFNELPIMTPSKINALLEDDRAFERDYKKNLETIKYDRLTPTTSRNVICEEEKLTDLLFPGGRSFIKNTTEEEENKKIKNEENANSFAIITTRPIMEKREERKGVIFKERKQKMEDEKKEAKEKEIQLWSKKSFETPTKEVKLYSGQWLVISTGRTEAQRDLFTEAISYFKRKPEAAVKQRKVATITRVNLFKHRYGRKKTNEKH